MEPPAPLARNWSKGLLWGMAVWQARMGIPVMGRLASLPHRA